MEIFHFCFIFLDCTDLTAAIAPIKRYVKGASKLKLYYDCMAIWLKNALKLQKNVRYIVAHYKFSLVNF